ncbi:MAG: hypothetical protein A2Z18_02770 [Armatimonadetes bacterium RBG_16_58_9]|nr:MAG: hypothetical protein A2Z18_02770 [Armatimonadetes bacterium RBG_16_58_9]
MVTKQDIIEGLRKLGLRDGDLVLVHSSLSSFGKVDGGAETVVDALLETVGPRGTLVVPTFSWTVMGGEPFEVERTPSEVGKITEEVRLRPEAVRSGHPTHSVAAIGPLAEALTEGHDKTHPMGRGSPLFKVLQANGKILQLGTNQMTNTMVHVAEEIAAAPYLEQWRVVNVKSRRGKIVRKRIRRPGCSAGFCIIDAALRKRGEMTETLIGNCRARLMTARAVVDAAIEELKLDPAALLCDRPDCERCAEARAMIIATDLERQDQEVIELAKDEERTLRIIERRLDIGEVKYFDAEENGSSPN